MCDCDSDCKKTAVEGAEGLKLTACSFLLLGPWQLNPSPASAKPLSWWLKGSPNCFCSPTTARFDACPLLLDMAAANDIPLPLPAPAKDTGQSDADADAGEAAAAAVHVQSAQSLTSLKLKLKLKLPHGRKLTAAVLLKCNRRRRCRRHATAVRRRRRE